MEVADVVVMRAVLETNSENFDKGLAEADQKIMAWAKKSRPAALLGIEVSDAKFGQSMTKAVEKATAKVEVIQRTSQGKQAVILQEGEARRAAIEMQGAQRRLNTQTQTSANVEAITSRSIAKQLAIEEEGNTRLELQQRAHLQKLILAKEKAEARDALPLRRNARNAVIGQALNQAGNALTMGVTAPIAAGAALTLNEGIKFESSFAGVKKTVEGTVTQLRELQFQIRDMAAGKNPIPITTDELNAIAESAGELGIKTPMVAQFTKTMAMLGTTTNLSSDQAAQSLARIDNILGTGQKSFDRYGAALVDLGNHGASTESEIVNMSQRLAGEAKQIGLAAPQVLGFGSAMASVGIDAEAGGSAISQVWKKIDSAVRSGGKSLEDLARVSGMSSAQFKKSWETDAAGATVAFVQGLGKIKDAGGSAAGTLDTLGMKGIRQQDALLRLAGAGSLLHDQLQIGERAWQQNSALAEEAGKRYETTASQIQILQNRLREMAISASEGILPGLNKELKGFSDGIPEMAQKAAAAYEALGPAGQKAALGALAVAAAAGPTLKAVNAVKDLVEMYEKLSGAELSAKAASAGITAAGAVEGAGAVAGVEGLAAEGAGAVALASNPVGWIILAAAIVAAISLALKFKGSYDEILERNRQLALDAKTLEGAFKRAFDGAPTNNLKKQLGDLQEQATAAKGDVDKLHAAIQKAQDTDLQIKKMGLAPSADLPLRQELRDIIASLQSQFSISLKVRADNTPAGTIPPGFKAQGRSFVPMTEEDIWGPRAAAVAMTLPGHPAAPRAGGKAGVPASEMARYTSEMTAYNAALAQTKTEIVALEQEDKKLESQAHAERFDARANDAIAKYGNNLSKLLDLQKQFDAVVKGGYKPDAAENRAMGFVGFHVNDLKATVLANRKAHAATSTTPAVDPNAATRAESIADQARADTGRLLSEQLSTWKSFESTVDGVRSGIAQTVESGNQVTGAVARAKMEAQLAREQFDGIPQPLKDSVIALAGIHAELLKIVGEREAIRQTFNGIFSGLGSADQSKFAAFAQRFQKDLKLGPQVTGLLGDAKFHSDHLRGATDTQIADLKSQIRLNQLAGRKGFDDPKNPNDGSMVTAARALVGQTGANAQVAGGAYGKEWCVGFVQSVRKNAGLSELANGTLSVKGLRSWAQNTGRVTKDPQPGDVFTVDRPGLRHTAIVSGRNGNTVSTIGGNEGNRNNFASKVKEGATYNINAPGVMFIRPEDAARTSRVVKGAFITAPVKDSARKEEPIGGFDPRVLTAVVLPKSFGTSMADYQARPGESTNYRQQLESLILKLLGDGAKIPDRAIRDASKTGFNLDLSKSRQNITHEAYVQMAGMNKEIRLIGHQNNPYFALLDEFQHGAKTFETEVAKQRELGTTARLMVERTRQATRDMRRDISGSVGANREVAPMLSGGNFNRGAYDRALFQSQKRTQIWNSDDIRNLRDAGMEIEANRQAVIRLNLEMAQFDSDRSQGVALGRAGLFGDFKEEAKEIAAANDLLRAGKTNAADVAQEVEKMAYYAKQYQTYITGGTDPRVAGMMAAQDTKIWEDNRDGKSANVRQGDIKAVDKQNELSLELAQRQAGLNAKYREGSAELRTRTALLEKEIELKRHDATAPDNEKLGADEIKRQVAAYGDVLQQQERAAKIQESKNRMAEAQNEMLDQQQSREEALAKTAMERLQIELKYEELKRQNAADSETEDEAAARRAVDQERAKTAAQEDRIQRTQGNRDQVSGVIDTILGGDLSGLQSQAVSAAREKISKSIAGRIFKTPKQDGSGFGQPGLSAFLQGPPTLDIFQQLAAHAKGNPAIPNGVTPYVSDSRLIPNQGGDVASTLRSMLAGGITATHVEVRAPIAQVNGTTVNVAQGAGGLGFPLIGGRSNNGGSGTTPTSTQMLSGLQSA